MEAPYPALAFPDRVQLYKLEPGVNTGGGKKPAFVATGGPLPCRVGRMASRAKDLEIVTETETEYEVSFPTRPGGEKGDLYAWLDRDGDEIDRLSVTQAATPRDASGRIWTAYGVIVQ